MEKKILFLRAQSGWRDPSPPMAFAYLGAIAKKNGFKVLVENLNSIYNTKTKEDIVEVIKKENPDIIGVSIFTNYAKNSYELIKKIRPFAKTIVVGGPHITIYPQEAIEMGADISVIGEAEAIFPDLLKALTGKKKIRKVNGIMYKENGIFIKNPMPKILNLDKLPMPDKDIFDKKDYLKVPEEINSFGGILSSRGCPGQCSYCYHSLFGRCFRYRSAENVFKEIKYLHDKYGIKHINFIDDAFTVNKKRLLDLCKILIKSNLGIEWVCATRIDFLTKEIIFKMKEAGCTMISLGIESCVPETLVKMKKTSNPEWYIKQSEDVLKWCKEAGIRAGVNILTGFPWDTAEDIRKIQAYIKKINPYVTQSYCGGILQPLPETEIYDQYAKKYKFEKWWLTKENFLEEDYHPFFMMYYHPFWEQLNNNFFNLDKEVFKEIDKLYRMMGKWNLRVIVKRRFKNRLKSFTIYNVLFILSYFSYISFKISPEFEKLLMKPIERYSYKFKFKK